MATISLNGTYYQFTVTAANATAGATYTNNGVTYTVNKTIAGGTKLVMTATAGAVTSGTTLTKASGTGDATITFSAVSLTIEVNELTYVAGDTISVSGYQEFLINATPTTTLGPVQATANTPGTISLSNTSTTTPIVVSLNTNTSDFILSGIRNILRTTNSDWIQIATGTGGAGQTIDFSATGPMGVAIDYPPCVWVETGNATDDIELTVGGVTGYYRAFTNAGATTDTSAINIKTDTYGGLDEGHVFQWNNTTKLATFGDGGAVGTSNGGAVIPNGAKVVYPNIHITSTTYTSTLANRNELRPSDGATVTIDKVAFSKNWMFGMNTSWSGTGPVTLTHVGLVGRNALNGVAGASTLDDIVLTVDPDMALTLSTQFQILNNTGQITIGDITTLYKSTSTFMPIVSVNNTTKIASIGRIRVLFVGAANAAAYSLYFDACFGSSASPLIVEAVYETGSTTYIRGSQNIHISNIYHADTATRVANTTASTQTYTSIGSKNITIAKIRAMNANSTACRGVIGNFGQDCEQYAVKDVVYDGKSNSATMGSHVGRRGYVSNVTFDNPRTQPLGTSLATNDVRFSNVRSSLTTMAQLSGATYNEWVSGTTSSYSSTSPFDVLPAQLVWTNSGRTTGTLVFCPVSGENNLDLRTTVTGTEGTDWYVSTSYLFYEGNGVELQWEHPYPVRGITDFSGATFSTLGTSATTNATIEFSMRSYAPESDWNSWYDASTGANWQTALDELDAYDSDKGFWLRWRITTSAALSGRNLRRAYVTCTPDSTWTPAEIGFVPLTLSGYVTGSTAKLYDNTVPASPVSVYAYSVTGTSRVLDFPYDFDATAKDFKVRVRKPGYGQVDATGETYHGGTSVPVSQTQYVSVDEVAAAAITGISINGSLGTVTVSQDRTLSELYAYCQWWAAQLENMDYDIPLVTTDGENYTSTYSWTINSGVDLTGTGLVDLGSETLTMNGTSTFDWRYNGKSWTRIALSGLTANSRVYIYDETNATEVTNEVASGTTLSIEREWNGVNSTLDIRITYVNGATAKLPWQQAAVFTESGTSVIVSQENDTVYIANAISGSTVTEFATDYPNIQVDIDDADGGTSIQRLYAWFTYQTYTEQGIYYFFDGITAEDEFNYRINVSVVDLELDNVSAISLPVQIVGARLYRDDGTTVIYSGSKSIQMDPDKAYIANSATIENGMLTVGKFLALK